MVPEPVLRRIASARDILLTSHANPDGDAIGSELGLAGVLRSLGKRVVIWNFHPVPPVYAALPGAAGITIGETPPEGFPDHFDLAIVLECPTPDRTGLESALAKLPIVNIDHHLGNAGYGEATWIDTSRPAVGVMVHDLAAALGVRLDADVANCLLVALVTDTGGFRFANATPQAFESAARLLRDGADIETVSRWLYESQPEGAVRLLGELLATLRRHHGGRIATAHLTRVMFERAGAAPGDSEGLIDTPRSIDGVDAVALFREVERDAWKVSLRSRGAIDVQAVARGFGGGGHRNASGCRLDGALTEVEQRILAALVAACEESA